MVVLKEVIEVSAMLSYEDELLAPVQPSWHFRTAREIEDAPRTRWLVKQVLPADGLAILYGASSSGKTFLALDLAIDLAGNVSWFGHKIPINVGVVYLPLEAGGGIANRLAAQRLHRGHELPGKFRVLQGASIDLTDVELMSSLGCEIASLLNPGAVVIIDTLARATPGRDENSGADMGDAIAGAQALQMATGGLVILVHHTGKDKAKGARGHSSLFAAADAVIEVSRDANDLRSWSLAKSKDGEDGGKRMFKLTQTVVGTDEDNDPVTSCTVEPDGSAAAALALVREPSGANQITALSELRAALAGDRAMEIDGRTCLAYVLAIEIARGSLIAEGMEAKRAKQAAAAAVDGLIKGKHLGSSGTALQRLIYAA